MVGRLDKIVADGFGGLRIFPDDARRTSDVAQWQ
jgi:hypothetical protein